MLKYYSAHVILQRNTVGMCLFQEAIFSLCLCLIALLWGFVSLDFVLVFVKHFISKILLCFFHQGQGNRNPIELPLTTKRT